MNGIIIYNSFDIAKNKWFISSIIDSFKEKGINVELIEESTLDYKSLNCVDFAIYRGRDYRISKSIEDEGILVINNSKTNKIANDKYLFYQNLAGHSFPCMETCSFIDEICFSPFVAKPKDGHGGNGVYLFSFKEEYLETVDFKDRSKYIFQKPSSDLGIDLRVYVLNKKIYGSVLRKAKEGEFRSNFSLGGNVTYFEPPIKVREMALKIANEFDSFFVGIDFILDKGNWIVNEMEDPVGTRMLYQTSSKNVVSDYVNEMILKYGLK